MASTFSISTALLLLIFTNTVLVTAVPEPEYYSMLSALRFRGYHLFANAITTTDLRYDILSGSNFTFFAPIDSALYSLDMSMSAADYTMALRFHGVPHRLSLPDLRMLPYGSNSFPSLVRGHEIHILNPLLLPFPVVVEGIDIAFPGLFYDEHIAVHGLEGIIDFRSLADTGNSTSILGSNVASNSTRDHGYETAATNLTNVQTPTSPMIAPFPQPPSNSTVNQTIAVTEAAAPRPSSKIAEPPVLVPQSTSIVPSPAISTDMKGISIAGAPPHRPPEVYSASTPHGREEHMSTATRYELISEKIPGVSLATKSTANPTEEFTQVDDKNIDCPVTDDDGERLNIANIRHGELYARELYTPINMTCAQE
ncbi:hypothetical protein LXL04_001384 [Taraxacum kok-saghyz]